MFCLFVYPSSKISISLKLFRFVIDCWDPRIRSLLTTRGVFEAVPGSDKLYFDNLSDGIRGFILIGLEGSKGMVGIY